MTIDTNAMISITEANQNFSKVARIVDELGNAVILKNNTPRYLVIDFNKAEQEMRASDEDVMELGTKRIVSKYESKSSLIEYTQRNW